MTNRQEKTASYHISIVPHEASFHCAPQQSVLAAMVAAGLTSLPIGCRSGGCGVCRVKVLRGLFESSLSSKAQITDGDRAEGIALACRLQPRSDLQLQPLTKKPWILELGSPASTTNAQTCPGACNSVKAIRTPKQG